MGRLAILDCKSLTSFRRVVISCSIEEEDEEAGEESVSRLATQAVGMTKNKIRASERKPTMILRLIAHLQFVFRLL